MGKFCKWKYYFIVNYCARGCFENEEFWLLLTRGESDGWKYITRTEDVRKMRETLRNYRERTEVGSTVIVGTD